MMKFKANNLLNNNYEEKLLVEEDQEAFEAERDDE